MLALCGARISCVPPQTHAELWAYFDPRAGLLEDYQSPEGLIGPGGLLAELKQRLITRVFRTNAAARDSS
jgi:hypothetical protein